MEAVNGAVEGGPPPPSPLTGCYLLIVIGEPHSQEHKDIILQRVAKGLLSWDVNECLVDLEKELALITEQAPEGEEARYGERLIQFASENLVTEVLIHPAISTLAQCVRNLLSSFTRHRHIIHAGYTFAANGSWALQDGTFSLADFSEASQELEVQRVIRAYENSITVDIHCSTEGDWARLPKEPFTKSCKLRINPVDVLTSGSTSITNFLNYISPFLIPTDIESLLESSDVVGNIRFSHPTLYVFPGGQGDAALFGINGFNMLLDGGFSRKACFWDFVRHLDRLDAVLYTRLNNSNVSGINSVLKRKRQNAVYPQIGHFFCNIQERKALLSPDGDKDKDPLLINLHDEGQDIVNNLRALNLNPQCCYRDSDPINLYHKVGHGTLDMYVLSPSKDSKEVKDFMHKWNNNDPKLFYNPKSGKDFVFPVENLVSICALLVWQPASADDTITRILFPGSTPQPKIFEGLDKLKQLEFIKHPVCTEKSLNITSSIHKPKSTKEYALEKIFQSDAKPQRVLENRTIKDRKSVDKPKDNKPEILKNGNTNGLSEDINNDKVVKKSDSTESDKSAKATKPRKPENKEVNGKLSDDKGPVDKLKHKPKEDIKQKPEVKTRSKIDTMANRSIERKAKLEKKPSPTTPKKSIENNVNGEMKDKNIKQKPQSKSSPSATPAKSAKEATNRKVVESKYKITKKDYKVADKKTTQDRRPVPRKLKGTSPSRQPGSPIKKLNGVQKPDLTRKAKLDKEGTTDSSTVSTPSADQDNILKKDISKLTPEELEQLKAQELADLKEEQEVVKEIEAVFRKGEERDISESDLRKVKDVSVDEKTEPEEYLIIEKEEVEHDSLDEKEQKEDETQKHTRDSEESEKQRKLSADKEVEENIAEVSSSHEGLVLEASVQSKETAEQRESEKPSDAKEVSTISPEEKVDISSDKKVPEDEDGKQETAEQNNALESQPDEKISATIESGATTAPTLPEDERITLDEIKEDNGDQVIEEKHVKEETKEKDVPIIQLPPKTFEPLSKIPPVVGIRLDKQSHIRDIVKTPDEVADLPVHEEVDIDHYDEFQPVYKEAQDNKQKVDGKQITQTDVTKSTEQIAETDIEATAATVESILNAHEQSKNKVLSNERESNPPSQEERKPNDILKDSGDLDHGQNDGKSDVDLNKFEAEKESDETAKGHEDIEIIDNKTDIDQIKSGTKSQEEKASTTVIPHEICPAESDKIPQPSEEHREDIEKCLPGSVPNTEEVHLQDMQIDEEVQKSSLDKEDEKMNHAKTELLELSIEKNIQSAHTTDTIAAVIKDKINENVAEDYHDELLSKESTKTIQPEESEVLKGSDKKHDAPFLEDESRDIEKSIDTNIKSGILEDVSHQIIESEVNKIDIEEPKSSKPIVDSKECTDTKMETSELNETQSESPYINYMAKDFKGDFIEKAELGRKSPKEREEDVAKIVASVAEVLKSDAPLEEFEGKLPFTSFTSYPPFTQELRETHITTLDSPITEDVATIQKAMTESIIPDELEPKAITHSFIEEEKKLCSIDDSKPSSNKITDLLRESNELMQASSKIISDIKTAKEQDDSEIDAKADPDQCTVHRMLVTASSEDGGEETVICPPGSITFAKSSDSSGRSSPDLICTKSTGELKSDIQESEMNESIKDVVDIDLGKEESTHIMCEAKMEEQHKREDNEIEENKKCKNESEDQKNETPSAQLEHESPIEPITAANDEKVTQKTDKKEESSLVSGQNIPCVESIENTIPDANITSTTDSTVIKGEMKEIKTEASRKTSADITELRDDKEDEKDIKDKPSSPLNRSTLPLDSSISPDEAGIITTHEAKEPFIDITATGDEKEGVKSVAKEKSSSSLEKSTLNLETAISPAESGEISSESKRKTSTDIRDLSQHIIDEYITQITSDSTVKDAKLESMEASPVNLPSGISKEEKPMEIEVEKDMIDNKNTENIIKKDEDYRKDDTEHLKSKDTNNATSDDTSSPTPNKETLQTESALSGKSAPDLKDLELVKDTLVLASEVVKVVNTTISDVENQVHMPEEIQITGKITPDIKDNFQPPKQETCISGKSTPVIDNSLKEPSEYSGESTPDIKDSVQLLKNETQLSEKSTPESKDPMNLFTEDLVAHGKSTPDMKDHLSDEEIQLSDKHGADSKEPLHLSKEETEASEKSTPDIHDHLHKSKEDLHISGKSTPDIKQSSHFVKDESDEKEYMNVSIHASGKSTPEIKEPSHLSKEDIPLSGKSTPDMKNDIALSKEEKQASGKSTPDVMGTSKISGTSTPDIKENVHASKEDIQLSGKGTPDMKNDIPLSKEEKQASGKSTPDVMGTSKISGTSTPDIKENVHASKEDIQLSGKGTPDMKNDIPLSKEENQASGKSTPDVMGTSKISGTSTPDIKENVHASKEDIQLSGKGTPDMKNDIPLSKEEKQASGKSTPDVMGTSKISGTSTPDIKENVRASKEDIQLSGKGTPDFVASHLVNDAIQESGKSTPDIKNHIHLFKEDAQSSGKSTPDLKDLVVGDFHASGKSTPEIKEQSNLIENEQKSEKSSTGLNDFVQTPLKEIQESVELLPGTVHVLKQEAEDSGKSSPEHRDTLQSLKSEIQNTTKSALNDQNISSGKETSDDKYLSKEGSILEAAKLSQEISSKTHLSSGTNNEDALKEASQKSELSTPEIELSGQSTPDCKETMPEDRLQTLKSSLDTVKLASDKLHLLRDSSGQASGESSDEELVGNVIYSTDKASIENVDSKALLNVQIDDPTVHKQITSNELGTSDSSNISDKIIQDIKVHEIEVKPHVEGAYKLKEAQEIPKHDKHISRSPTPPTVPASPVIKDNSSMPAEEHPPSTNDAKSEKKYNEISSIASIKEAELRSATPGSDEFDFGINSTHSDISSGQASRAPHQLESDRRDSDDEDIPGSPTSVTSQLAQSICHYDIDELRGTSINDPMNTSFYGALPEEINDGKEQKLESIDLGDATANRSKESLSVDTNVQASLLYELTKAKYSTGVPNYASEIDDKETDIQEKLNDGNMQDLMTCSFIGTELPSQGVSSDGKDPIASWSKPLGLPSPAPPSDNKGTPKKERKLPPNVTAKNKLNDDKKRSESPSKYDKKKKVVPVYVDLTYVPHHGNSNYSYVDFFKRVRARYYVFSGIEPSKEVYNALLEAKQTWEDKDLEVTIIPTYDTDVLGYWVAENEDLLTKYKIDLSPSASRCTINLQDHETSCSAYRLEF